MPSTEDNGYGMCCHDCGRPADKYSSGNPECWPCWNRRKMDLPAAQHWARVAEEFLSNVDMWDLTHYLKDCGLDDDQMRIMIESARKVRDYSKAMLEAGYGPVEMPTVEKS